MLFGLHCFHSVVVSLQSTYVLHTGLQYGALVLPGLTGGEGGEGREEGEGGRVEGEGEGKGKWGSHDCHIHTQYSRFADR